MLWHQFSIGSKDGISLSLSRAFLKSFYEMNHAEIDMWHFLYEPNLLVRFISKSHRIVTESAQNIAALIGLGFSLGDLLNSSPSGHNGYEWWGEEEFYGAKIWELNAQYMNICASLSIELQDSDYRELLRKFFHLTTNMFAMERKDEVEFFQFCVDKSKRLMVLTSEEEQELCRNTKSHKELKSY